MENKSRDRSGHKMVSLKGNVWEKVEFMAAKEGLSRSAIITLAVSALWRERGYEKRSGQDGEN